MIIANPSSTVDPVLVPPTPPVSFPSSKRIATSAFLYNKNKIPEKIHAMLSSTLVFICSGTGNGNAG